MRSHLHLMVLSTVFLTIVLPLVARAERDTRHKDWPNSEEWPNVLETAERTGQPIAIVRVYENMRYTDAHAAALKFLRHRYLRSIPRVMLEDSEFPKWLMQIRNQTKSAHQSEWVELFIALPVRSSNGKLRVVLFMDEDDASELNGRLHTVQQVVKWVSGVPADIRKADYSAESGRFDIALKQIETIEKEDQQIAQITRKLIGSDGQPELWYPLLLDQKNEEYEKLANQMLEQAQGYAAKKDYRQALATLRPLRACDAFDMNTKAKQLIDEIREQQRSNRNTEEG